MENQLFKVEEWLSKSFSTNASNNKKPSNNSVPSSNTEWDIERITQRIESAAIDIAPNYADWRDLGFALADEMGEHGRGYYHRLSRFYPDYSASETDKQYNACLKAHGHGITIKTLFHLAKQAGIRISDGTSSHKSVVSNTTKKDSDNAKSAISPVSPPEETEETADSEPMPTFSQEVGSRLPKLLSEIVSCANSHEDADLLLLGALTVFSACLPNIYGNYGSREVFPNLFLFVTAQASAGKGRLTLCRHIVQPIHDKLRQQYVADMEEYRRKQKEYARDKKNNDPPDEPPIKTLLIPANSSATAVYQVLNDNNGVGLLFETEGDTLANTFKSDYGNFSDGFRKAFHHEMISYIRRKDREFVELARPRLSALLSGTPQQILSLIPNAENGLFSRFIFYYLNVRLEWLNVFADSKETLDQQFEQLGKQFYELYCTLQTSQPICFELSDSQQTQFNSFFEQVQTDYSNLFGLDIVASVRRFGLITFRIAMILTALRIIDNAEISPTMVCFDDDFQTAKTMALVLLRHTAKVYDSLMLNKSLTQVSGSAAIRQSFFDSLPPQFNRQDYIKAALQLNIPPKTAEKHISRFCTEGKLKHMAQGKYEKA